MSKHTPGPWKYNANTRQIGVVDTSDTQSYGMMLSAAYIDECDHSEYAVNARLIASAPDLLALLKEARSTLEMWKDVAPAVSLCADIDKAIAQATGG